MSLKNTICLPVSFLDAIYFKTRFKFAKKSAALLFDLEHKNFAIDYLRCDFTVLKERRGLEPVLRHAGRLPTDAAGPDAVEQAGTSQQ